MTKNKNKGKKLASQHSLTYLQSDFNKQTNDDDLGSSNPFFNPTRVNGWHGGLIRTVLNPRRSNSAAFIDCNQGNNNYEIYIILIGLNSSG